MKWIYRWLDRKLRNTRNQVLEADKAPSITSGRSIDSNGMNFTVYRASGGHVIETRTYDRHKDRNNMGLHIITDDKDLGEEIGKIITFEHLRN